MAVAPFNINEALPGDTDLISAHPSNARTFRDVVESWLLVEHDTYGHHKVPSGSTASRDAQDNIATGNLWLRTDTTPATLQRYTGSAWEDVSAGNALTADAADAIAAGGVDYDAFAATVFSGLTGVTPATDDEVPIADTSDSGSPKKVTVSDILALVPAPGWVDAGNTATTSGTSVSVTGLSAGINEIIIHLEGVSQDTANTVLQLQIGDSGGLETSGYSGAGGIFTGAGNGQNNSAGFTLTDASNYDAATDWTGVIVLRRLSGNIWSCDARGVNTIGSVLTWFGCGLKTLSAELDRFSLTTVAGAATFDTGTLYYATR